MIASEALIRWLTNGERGESSNTIVTHLTGIDALGSRQRRNHPHDPDDLRRCRLLLEAMPELEANFANMATCSKVWNELRAHWDELCNLMDKEAPRWREGQGSAIATYRRMKELTRIDTSTQRVAA